MNELYIPVRSVHRLLIDFSWFQCKTNLLVLVGRYNTQLKTFTSVVSLVHQLLWTGEMLDPLNLKIGKMINNLNLEIGEVCHDLPFAWFVWEVINVLYV